jgi:hypothetical protein
METLILSLSLHFFSPRIIIRIRIRASSSCLHTQQVEASWTLDAFCEGRKE